MNPSKKKGTAFEVKLLASLRAIWPNLQRSAPGTESNDFTGHPLGAIEAKRRTSPSTSEVQTWVRKITKVARGKAWMIHASLGDKRTHYALEDITIMPTWYVLRLLALAEGMYDADARSGEFPPSQVGAENS